MPCSFGLYSGYLKRFCIVCPPVISEFGAKIQSLALLSASRERVESSTLEDLVQVRENPGFARGLELARGAEPRPKLGCTGIV